MKSIKSLRLGAMAVASAAAVQPFAAHAAYPERAIQMVIPFPAGGATDVLGRLVAAELGTRLKQTVVVENRAGAGTSIGAAHVARAKPDGYTLMLTSTTTFTVNPAIYKNLAYDPGTSYDAIGQVGSTGLMLLANPKLGAANLADFVAQARAKPKELLYGSFGSGTTAHFAGAMLTQAANIELTHVPYKGSAPAMTDLIGGQLPYTVDTTAAAVPQVKAGAVRALATTASKRSALLPDVPTAAESGFPEVNMDTWLAVVVPKGLPTDARALLEKTVAEIVADPAFQTKLVETGFEPDYATGAQVDARIKRDTETMKALAQKANIQLD